jgi:filamentous hemagglutinin family protein
MSGISTHWFLGTANCCAIGSAFGVAVSLTIATSANCALAQIIPDSTLPNNSSVNSDGTTFNITGGTSAASNLFHSFQQFSVPNGNAAIFQNPVNILNIISRVTGGSTSNIDGQIGTSGLGRANLFLINPNGIVFGSNATLNVGGSFVATTANAIGFGNQGIFSASNPNNPALLTVNLLKIIRRGLQHLVCVFRMVRVYCLLVAISRWMAVNSMLMVVESSWGD